MNRIAICAAFERRILQGSIDPIWSDAEKGDILQEAIDYIWERIVDSPYGEGFYLTRKASLSGSGATWTLPTDFYRSEWVQESDTIPIYPVRSTEKERSELRQGFRIVGRQLILVNFNTYPTTVQMDYFKYPKQFTLTYDHTNTADTEAPEAPLEDARGGLLVAKVMLPIAKSKSGEDTQLDWKLADKAINLFVNRLGGRHNMGAMLAGV